MEKAEVPNSIASPIYFRKWWFPYRIL